MSLSSILALFLVFLIFIISKMQVNVIDEVYRGIFPQPAIRKPFHLLRNRRPSYLVIAPPPFVIWPSSPIQSCNSIQGHRICQSFDCSYWFWNPCSVWNVRTYQVLCILYLPSNVPWMFQNNIAYFFPSYVHHWPEPGVGRRPPPVASFHAVNSIQVTSVRKEETFLIF